MAMKIDLDDLESDAAGAPVLGCVADCASRMTPHSCAAVTIALIERIRELEAAVESAADDLVGVRMAHRAALLTQILEKGAVLP